EQHADLAVHVDVAVHDALRGDPALLFGGGSDAFLAEIIDRFFHVAVSLDESFLAVHHANACALTEFHNVFAGKCHNISPIIASKTLKCVRLAAHASGIILPLSLSRRWLFPEPL